MQRLPRRRGRSRRSAAGGDLSDACVLEGLHRRPRRRDRWCATCRSTSRPARSPRCSAPTAPASRAWCSRVAGVLTPESGTVKLGEQRPHRPPARAIRAGRRGRRARGPAAAAGPDGGGQPRGRHATRCSRERCAGLGASDALELFPELQQAARHARRARCPAASSRWSCSPRRSCRSRSSCSIDELSLGLAPVDRQAPDPDDPHGRRVGRRRAADRAVRHVALGLANRAHVMDGGAHRASRASASELKENPELLHSSYLLRGGKLEAAG